MNDSTFKTLGIAAAIMVVLAVVVGSCKPTVEFDNSGIRYLVPSLDPGSVNGVEVQNGADRTKLVREGQGFAVATKQNYPASNQKFNELIETCAKIRTTARITESASDHADLGVVEGAEGGQTIKFFDRDDKLILGVVAAPVENADVPGGGGFHVRLVGDDNVYHTAERLMFNGKGIDYIAKEIVKIENDDLAKVEVVTAASTYTVSSPEKGKVELDTVPEGKKVEGVAHESVFRAAMSLNLTDFVSQSEAKDLSFDSTFTMETRSKGRFTFELAEKSEMNGEGDEATELKKYYVRGQAEYLGGEVRLAKDDDDEKLKENEALLLMKDKVESFNRAHQSWVYEIPSYTAENMRKPLDDLVVEDDGKPSEVAASHILVSYEGAERSEVTGRTKEEAQTRAADVLAQVKAGEKSFEDLAKEFSDGPSGVSGGSLGTFKFDAMAQPFSEAAFGLEIGAISELVETKFGFHIIRRDS